MYDFFDAAQAAQYLSGTIVRFKGSPTLVHSVDYNNPRSRKLTIYHLPLRQKHEGMQMDGLEGFDFKPFRLGMYNFSFEGKIIEAAWMQRYPARRWKIGLDRNGISVVPVRKAEDNIIFDILKARNPPHSWNINYDMANMLEGLYPTLAEALSIMGKRTRCSVAFSSDFAVTGTRKIIYRHSEQPVGKVIDGTPVLHPNYRQLDDMLQEEWR